MFVAALRWHLNLPASLATALPLTKGSIQQKQKNFFASGIMGILYICAIEMSLQFIHRSEPSAAESTSHERCFGTTRLSDIDIEQRIHTETATFTFFVTATFAYKSSIIPEISHEGPTLLILVVSR
jgi:hypothetical protein